MAGDHTAPQITPHWPENETEIASDSFDLLCELDDPCATVTVAGLTEEPIEGLVDRDGLVWVDDLPLSPGANTLTLTATDAAGNSSELTLVVNRTEATIAIADPTEAQLAQTRIPVTGTITEVGYAVWVNGVRAVVETQANSAGTFDWTALDVPLDPVGPAVIQARAIPLSHNNGNGDGQGSAWSGALGNPSDSAALTSLQESDPPPRLLVLQYVSKETEDQFTADGSPVPGDTFSHRSSEIIWNYGQESTRTDTQTCGTTFYETLDIWPADAWEPTKSGKRTTKQDGIVQSTTSIGPLTIDNEVCNNVAVTKSAVSGLGNKYIRKQGYTDLRLVTGGKKRKNAKHFFVIQCLAWEVLDKRWHPPRADHPLSINDGTAAWIDPTKLTLCGQHPDQNALLSGYNPLKTNWLGVLRWESAGSLCASK